MTFQPQPIAFGTARIRRNGSDIALISVGVGVHRGLEAATTLAEDGIEDTVLDLRSIAPLDHDAIVDVARRCKRVVTVDGDYLRGGRTGEIAAILMQEGLSREYRQVAVESTIPFAPPPGIQHPPQHGQDHPGLHGLIRWDRRG